MATVRNLALAWFTTLGLVAFCLLCSPFPLFRLWSVQAMDTCMAVLQSNEQSSIHGGRKCGWVTQSGECRGKLKVPKSVLFKFLDSVSSFFLQVCVQVLLLFCASFFFWIKSSVAHFQKLCLRSQSVKAFPLFVLFCRSHIKSSIVSLSLSK